MAPEWLGVAQALTSVAALVVAIVAAAIAWRSTEAQRQGAEVAQSLLRLEEAREDKDQARFRLLMEELPYHPSATIQPKTKVPIQLHVENSGNQGADVLRVDLELTEENGKTHRPAVEILRADPQISRTNLLIEARRVARVDVFIEPKDVPEGLRLAACRMFVRVVPVRGEPARAEWPPTEGSAEWLRYL